MTYRPMTRARYRRLCEVMYRLELNGRRSRWASLAFNLRISKALFDDHGEFYGEW